MLLLCNIAKFIGSWLFGRWPCADEHIHMQTSRLIDLPTPSKVLLCRRDELGLVHMLMKVGFVLPSLSAAAPAIEKGLFTFSSL